MLYSKNGSIPKPETDGTEGWLEVPDMPAPVDGKEVVWLNWQWVVRDPKPVDREGYRWKWNHDQMQWIEYELPNFIQEIIESTQVLSSADVIALTSDQIQSLTTDQI